MDRERLCSCTYKMVVVAVSSIVYRVQLTPERPYTKRKMNRNVVGDLPILQYPFDDEKFSHSTSTICQIPTKTVMFGGCMYWRYSLLMEVYPTGHINWRWSSQSMEESRNYTTGTRWKTYWNNSERHWVPSCLGTFGCEIFYEISIDHGFWSCRQAYSLRLSPPSQSSRTRRFSQIQIFIQQDYLNNLYSTSTGQLDFKQLDPQSRQNRSQPGGI